MLSRSASRSLRLRSRMAALRLSSHTRPVTLASSCSARPIATSVSSCTSSSSSSSCALASSTLSSRLLVRRVASSSAAVMPQTRAMFASSSSSAAAADLARTPTPAVLRVQCSCGSVAIHGRGSSALNFVCHCSICRKASGLASLPAAGFKEENLVWDNAEGIRTETPPGSKNARYYCKKCSDYVGENALGPLGVIALPLHRAVSKEAGVPAVLDQYKPNHHIFYEFRAVDAPASDHLPKWSTLPEGKLVADSDSKPAQPSQAKLATPTLPTSGPQWDAINGAYRKDVQPLSPTRGPESKYYHFTENDPSPNHVSLITPEKVQERVAKKYHPSPGPYVAPRRQKRDAIVIGGGHNGLISAAYLAKKGLDVLVLERRHLVGGAAVTEELYPGFKFSRGSYLAGLLRPQIIKDLELEKYGFKYLPRNPTSFTPSLADSHLKGKHLFLGVSDAADRASIAQFSAKDAVAFAKYEHFLAKVREIVQPILDLPPPDRESLASGNLKSRIATLRQLMEIGKLAFKNRDVLVPFYELFTAPASHILDRWFESEILKTTLATDAVIGAMCSPKHIGSAYVLLHHVMGEAAGRKGVWAYMQGGMGTISNSIAKSAQASGAEIVTNATVKRILYSATKGPDGKHKVEGVEMVDGSRLYAPVVLSGANPYHTFLELLPGLARDSGYAEESPLPPDFSRHIRYADYSCGAVKINCAVKSLPNFKILPNDPSGKPGPQHIGTVHFETRLEEIENAHREAAMGIPATRPVVEMTIPSSLDRTIAPPGHHVVQFFVQFAPYDIDPKIGSWADPAFKNAFADRVFRIVEEHCPGFTDSVLYRDILTPLDIERIFGMQKGNIMHGALGLHQLFFARPAFGYAHHRTPVAGLYLAGAGAHPGGGVMGAPGRNCANVVLSDLGK